MRITLGGTLASILLAAATAAVVWAFTPRATPVETAPVTKGRFIASVDESGKTRVRERYSIAAPLAGRLGRIGLDVGDSVNAGDIVASIQPSPAPFLDPRGRREAEERLGATEAARERTLALVERARVQATQARTEVERARALFQRGVVSRQTLERDELAAQTAERDLRAAEFQDHAAAHEVDQAKALLARQSQENASSLERWDIRAPTAGVVLKLAQQSETIVAPGIALVEIGDARDLEIVVDVLSADAVEIKPGAEVIIERWGGPAPLAGRVRRVEPTAFTKVSTLGVEEQRVNIIIDVISPREEWARLGDNYRVEARIVAHSQDDATIAPTGALFRLEGSWRVYVVVDGRAIARAVEVTRRSGRFAAIGKGLSPGETVIVYPSDRVSPNARVAPREASSSDPERR